MTNSQSSTTTITAILLLFHVPITSTGVLGFLPNIKKNDVYFVVACLCVLMDNATSSR